MMASDPADFVAALDRALGFDTKFLNSTLDTVVEGSDAILVYVVFPYEVYRTSVREALRKRDPIDAVQVPLFVSVVVSPKQINAPDIVKVAVERNGREVAPVANLIRPSTFRTQLGASTVLHAGTVSYSCSVFAASGTVKVIAIPETGRNFELVLEPEILEKFQRPRGASIPEPLTSALVGLSEYELRLRYGSPMSIAQGIWTYRLANGNELRVSVTDGAVTEVSPAGIQLVTLPRRQEQVASTLVGQTRADVERLLGLPSAAFGARLDYDTRFGTLWIYVNEAGIVTEVSPGAFDISLIRRP